MASNSITMVSLITDVIGATDSFIIAFTSYIILMASCDPDILNQ